MKTELEELEELKDQRQSAYQVRNDYEAETSRLVAEIRMARVDGLTALQKAERDLGARIKAIEDAQRLAAAEWPFPEGTVFEKWARPIDIWRRDLPELPTGKLGRIELVTLDYDHGAMEGRLAAKVGQFVIRHLKKDGSRGARYERFHTVWGTKNPELPSGWRVKS